MPRRPPLAVVLERAGDRYRTQVEGLDTLHAFSFGRHYDPDRTSHGLLVARNEEHVRAGSGFDDHPHRDLEIVTWVLEGTLVHQDSAGHCGVVRPGVLQRLSAGTGVVHSERQDAAGDPGVDVRFVQAWVVPDDSGGAPAHAARDVNDLLRSGLLVPVASGMPQHGDAVPLRQRAAALHVARLAPGQAVQLPDAPFLHLSVLAGDVDVEGAGRLGPGDALRCTSVGGQRVAAASAAEVLVWEMHATLG